MAAAPSRLPAMCNISSSQQHALYQLPEGVFLVFFAAASWGIRTSVQDLHDVGSVWYYVRVCCRALWQSIGATRYACMLEGRTCPRLPSARHARSRQCLHYGLLCIGVCCSPGAVCAAVRLLPKKAHCKRIHPSCLGRCADVVRGAAEHAVRDLRQGLRSAADRAHGRGARARRRAPPAV